MIRQAFLSDFRYASRWLARSPGFTVAVVLTLGLGIGANAALFSVVNGLLLRPLPAREADRLVVLATQPEKQPISAYLSYPELLDYRQVRLFSDLLGHTENFAGFAVGDRAERILVSYVTGNFFSMLGIRPHAGRAILPSEGQVAGADRVVMLSYDFWQRQFNGDHSILGRSALLGGRPCTIVGIAPAGFRGVITGIRVDAYMPLGMAHRFVEWKEQRGTRVVRILGRLRPHVELAQAQAAVDVMSARLFQQYPASDRGVSVRVLPERLARPEPEFVSIWPPIIAVFLSLAGLVLLVACFNVANLLLVRATLRRGETAVRLSLGASRSRLLRQLLTESLLLALMGGAAGLALAAVASRLLQSLPLGGNPPVQLDLALDGRVLVYTVALVLGSCLFFGLAPALQSTRGSLSEVLHEQGRSAGAEGSHRLRQALVVLQIAVSLPLLMTAGLFVRSLAQARSIDLGFRAKNLLIISVDTDLQGYDTQRSETFFRRLRDEASALPGVRSAALSYSVPMGQYDLESKVAAAGRLPASNSVWPASNYNAIDDQYFAALGIPILSGRGFTEHDNRTSRRVAVVNQTLASRLWPGETPLGKRLVLGPTGPDLEVVGVAKNGKYGFLFEPPQPFFYIPLAQEPHALRALNLATSVRPEELAGGVRQVLRGLDPAMPALDLKSLDARLHDDLNGFQLPRIGGWLTGCLGLVGLVLSTVGLYAVISFITSRRRHEIGIRMALGAERGAILTMVVRQGLWLVLIALVLGLTLSLFSVQFFAAMLYGVAPYDPWTFAAVTVILAAVAVLALLIPARRASAYHPMVALRLG
jgi:macrolide transport system ATP-binding/permease protein